ncbi:MAG TPA: transglycosylase domain-containing protein [Acidimicrobiales bacterium]|nr:transglycosylase domain-containing protein [Acidimicrobiales bacterium]
MQYTTRILALVVAGALTLVLCAVALVPAVNTVRSAGSYTPEKLDLPAIGQRSLIFDNSGSLIGSFQDEINRSLVKLSDVPSTVVQSVLAVEDSDFYKHGPVDVHSIVRAMATNVKQGGVAQGGSTITQQVVKKTLTGSKITLSRKLREAFLAVQLERQLTKDQILERYLNIIYLGHGAYGVQAAAEVYFNKDVSKLDWAEGALLAALISNPNGYDPKTHPSVALEQRSLALRRLVETHRLSQAEADKANKEPLPTTFHTPPASIRDYFTQEVLRRLLSGDTPEGAALGNTQEARYNAVFRGGLRIYTTYDRGAQLVAEHAAQQSVQGVGGDPATLTYALPAYQGVPQQGTVAMASVEPSTGAVRVLVGGPPPTVPDQLDFATDSLKQPGSSFKTFVLVAAMEEGFVPSDTIESSQGNLWWDDPSTFQQVDTRYNRPQKCVNFSSGEGGVRTLTSATTNSVNCAYWRLGQVVGLEKVADIAKNMGITNCYTDTPDSKMTDAEKARAAQCMNPWYPVMSFGGTFGVHPLDMAAAYAVLANDGVRNAPYFVDKITDASGKVIYQHKADPQRVISSQTARLVTQVLVANVQGGTGTRARLTNGQQAAGKTGTTDEAKNLWFVGYTPQLATAVWWGDRGTAEVPMFGGSAQGGQYPARTWGLFMNELLALRSTPKVPFTTPDRTRGGVYLTMGTNDGQGYDPNVYRRAAPVVPRPAAPPASTSSSTPSSGPTTPAPTQPTVPGPTVTTPGGGNGGRPGRGGHP